MTRLQSIETAISKTLREKIGPKLSPSDTSVQITVRLFPDNGLVRKTHYNVEGEEEIK